MERREQKVPKSDIQITSEVMGDWMRGAGGDIAVQTIINYVSFLQKHFGDKFTINGVVTALDRLSQSALQIEQEIIAAKKSQTQNKP